MDLLKTIQIPMNLNQLSKILPKSKYSLKKEINRSGSKQRAQFYDKS